MSFTEQELQFFHDLEHECLRLEYERFVEAEEARRDAEAEEVFLQEEVYQRMIEGYRCIEAVGR